jgi:hypothetical protein
MHHIKRLDLQIRITTAHNRTMFIKFYLFCRFIHSKSPGRNRLNWLIDQSAHMEPRLCPVATLKTGEMNAKHAHTHFWIARTLCRKIPSLLQCRTKKGASGQSVGLITSQHEDGPQNTRLKTGVLQIK